MLKYLSIPGELLANPDLRSDEKILLAYLIGLAANQRYFFGSTDYLSNLFGAPIKAIEVSANGLIQKGMITRDAAGALRLAWAAEELYCWRKPTAQEKEVINKITGEISLIAGIKNMRQGVSRNES